MNLTENDLKMGSFDLLTVLFSFREGYWQGTWKKLTYPFAQGDHEGSPLQSRVVGAGLVPARVCMGGLFISESSKI